MVFLLAIIWINVVKIFNLYPIIVLEWVLSEMLATPHIENFKAKHVIGFVGEMQNKGLSSATQKNYMSAIRDFADRVGIDQRTIPSNKRLEIDTRVFGNVDRTWTDKEFQAFKEVAKEYDSKQGQGPRMELVLEVERNFGCRLEGILNLDINTISKAFITGELLTKEKNRKINMKPVERLEQRELLEILFFIIIY